MEAKDFRLGNLVKSVLTKKTYEIDLWALRVIEEGNYQNSHDTETKVFVPIQLTEQWLLDFGFKKKENTNIYVKCMHKISGEKLKSLAVYIDENKHTIALIDYYTGVEKTDLLHFDYEYVHQLQNLFSALTGEELKLKSK